MEVPGGPASKESAYNAGDAGLIPGWGRSPISFKLKFVFKFFCVFEVMSEVHCAQ